MSLARQTFRSVWDLTTHSVARLTFQRTHILLACMPKSGSTFLSNTIGRLPNFKTTSLVGHYGRVEQDINFSVAMKKSRHNYIAQQHVRYNNKTSTAIDTFGLVPIVLVRNIFDCVVSVRDHLRRESTRTPAAFVLDRHANMNDRDLETFIVQMILPWYFSFFVSWVQCDKALWLTYEEVISDPVRAIQRIMVKAGYPISDEEIAVALEKADPAADRMNSGVIGRGRTLHEENIATIERYRSFYPDIDFSRIGLV